MWLLPSDTNISFKVLGNCLNVKSIQVRARHAIGGTPLAFLFFSPSSSFLLFSLCLYLQYSSIQTLPPPLAIHMLMSASFEVAMSGATAMALAATSPQVNSGMRGGISVLREVMRCSGAQQPAVLEDERETITR